MSRGRAYKFPAYNAVVVAVRPPLKDFSGLPETLSQREAEEEYHSRLLVHRSRCVEGLRTPLDTAHAATTRSSRTVQPRAAGQSRTTAAGRGRANGKKASRVREKPGGEKVRIGIVIIGPNAVVMLEALDRINVDMPKVGR
jgi:hypothetical protein